MLANNFGASKNNLTKRVYVMCREAGIKIWVQIFGEHAARKFGRAKNVQNSARLRQILDFGELWSTNEEV